MRGNGEIHFPVVTAHALSIRYLPSLLFSATSISRKSIEIVEIWQHIWRFWPYFTFSVQERQFCKLRKIIIMEPPFNSAAPIS